MRYISLIQACFLTLYYNQASAIIVSPCKVRNLVTQPTYGTSLKTKSLVQIIQMPPVFVQNVMVGVCENPNQNVSTGRVGEFYTCQQRYSAVEVYIVEASPHPPNGEPYPNSPQASDNSLKFVRESVIIESGCDFTFNLLPLMASAAQGQNDNQAGGQGTSPQQRMILRSPFHQNPPIRRQPGQYADIPSGNPVPNYQTQGPVNSMPNYLHNPNTQGRSGQEDSDDIVTDDVGDEASRK